MTVWKFATLKTAFEFESLQECATDLKSHSDANFEVVARR